MRQVLELDEDFELTSDGLSVDEDFVERGVNEWDTYSLEEALAIKDDVGAEVVAVTVGDDEADEVLLTCLAKGADRAIRVARAANETFDPLVTARLLSAVVERESPDLVLCGVQASDTVNGATGAALAGLTGLSCVAVVRAIELSGEGVATVERELEGGIVEVLELKLPVVLTVQTGISEPRYATLRAIKQARDKPLDVLSSGELGLDDAAIEQVAGARLRRLDVPQDEGHAELFEGDAAAVAERIAELIGERLS
ncbi:MAG TPA: electron transfer flavoprotein subunit beta/FixA family protein [Baekduia sp.]|nr:electron transfer flavoprotein subunit beta/FixA family protein [Baekduia sp.]